MKIVESLTNQLASETAIGDFEKRLGSPLLGPYRRFLRDTNGGRPEPSAFHFRTESGEGDSSVDWFYTLSSDEDYNIEDNLHMFRERIPAGAVPIACDPFGNQILLGVAVKRGGVFFWDHEQESDLEPTWENIARVADSFDEFLQLLN
jgi:hypothetical protein